jgi:putative transposase
MPWREMLPMDQRMQFVSEFRSGLFTMTELVAHYGISRKTGYKWIARFETAGVKGLADQSRRPRQSPSATEPELIKAVVDLRHRHPRWGAKKLLAILTRREPTAAWPSRSTVCDLLTRAGVVQPRRRRANGREPRRSASLAPLVHANGTWTTDFKGEFRTGDGIYCHPLTLRDGWSRFVLRCDVLFAQTYEATRRRFERAFAKYGLPDRIRSDNGSPFASTGLGRLSRLCVWWMRLGIVPERIALGRPDQNGSHEQFHSVLKADTARPPAPNARAQQRRFDRFRIEYNYERPHEALQDQAPAACYTPSTRLLPRTLAPIEYPGHMETRIVSSLGCVSWGGRVLFVSEALRGEPIGFEEVDDGIWTVHFATVALARFDERRGRIQRIATE